jgi:hypothetical protein
VLMVVTGAAILLIDALGSRDEVPR